MTERKSDVWLLVARLLMASLFLWSGIEKIFDLRGAAGFAASGGIPFALQLMPLAILLELGCAIALILGWRTREAAILLALWMIILGPLFHQFWNAPPERWQESIDGFFHHLVMVGGMIYVAIFGPGRMVIGRSQAAPTTLH